VTRTVDHRPSTVDHRPSTVVPPLVFLHGFTGSAASWEPIVARLSALAEGHRAVCEAIYGHHPELLGRAEEGFEGEVDRLARQLVRLGRGPVHVVGYSLGARLALGMAVRHPEKIARATLIGCNPGLGAAPARRERIAADARWVELLRTQGTKRFAEAWEAQPLLTPCSRLPEAELSRVRAIRRQHDPEGLARSLETLGVGQMPDLRPALPRLALPVDLVAGAEDEKFVAFASEMARALPWARRRVVPRAGHDVGLEQPDALVAIILSDPEGDQREHDHNHA
jgi:2-succinyl-6-hydroxy-2,4-cyclohexadiene-1-carboxylate synthase